MNKKIYIFRTGHKYQYQLSVMYNNKNKYAVKY